ncbi:hypothetical protein GONAM_11_01200 [Gordonia namibiensis NBRC 108229]|uniref:Uncharacterized protein n=1 Tax=Gordonia namibiensis NBRC 108229 TaxID=1208314 RepID=K6WKN9_9ACTN|nr:hypothetical protein [Gordonia namibiensis]GAB99940.1 hypothetical protein GONAM_11_01200 [Gordonia namibiensis NBRC 108229]
MGRNGTQRSEKVARRADRKQKRQHRVVAGAAAIATVAAIGAGQAMEPAAAEAALLPDSIQKLETWSKGFNTGNPLGELVSGIGNGALADIAEAWRIESCVSGGSRDGADCSQSSTDLGGIGIAIVLPDRIEVVPVGIYDPVKGTIESISNSILGDIARWIGLDVPRSIADAPGTDGSAKVIGNGFQLAVAFRDGDATAISYLPLSIATAGASDGRAAKSFALLGAAHAWNTDPLAVTVLGQEIPLVKIPGIKGVGCYGGLTGAYADGVGACANVLGTFDFRYQQPNGEVQFALTDPTALFSDPTGVLGDAGQEALQGILAAILSGSGIDFDGDWMSLSKDFARLSIGGDYGLLSGNFLRLTSDYGFTGPITVDWLGSQVTFRPLVEVNGEYRPNRLGLPVITFGQLDTGEIIPVIHIPSYEFPFGIPATDDAVIPQSNTVARVAASAPAEFAASTFAEPETAEFVGPDHEASEVASDDSGSNIVEEYVGKHRAADDGYEGKHRAPEAPAAGDSDAGSDNDSDNSSGGDSGSGSGSDSGSDDGSGSDSGSDSAGGSGSGSGSDSDSGSGSGSDSDSGSSSGSGAEAA